MKSPSKHDIDLNNRYLRGQLSAGDIAKQLNVKYRHSVEARMARVTRWRVINGQIKVPKQ